MCLILGTTYRSSWHRLRSTLSGPLRFESLPVSIFSSVMLSRGASLAHALPGFVKTTEEWGIISVPEKDSDSARDLAALPRLSSLICFTGRLGLAQEALLVRPHHSSSCCLSSLFSFYLAFCFVFWCNSLCDSISSCCWQRHMWKNWTGVIWICACAAKVSLPDSKTRPRHCWDSLFERRASFSDTLFMTWHLCGGWFVY